MRGAMTLSVADPQAFADDVNTQRALTDSIAAMAGAGVSADDVGVTITVVDRRLQGSQGEQRRLQGSVRVDYTITVADATAASSLAAQMATLEPEAMEEATNASLDAFGLEPVTVEIVGAPQVDTRTETAGPVDGNRDPFRDSHASCRESGAVFAMTALSCAIGIA